MLKKMGSLLGRIAKFDIIVPKVDYILPGMAKVYVSHRLEFLE